MLSDLAFALAKEGHKVTVITSRQRYDAPDARLPHAETIEGVDIIRVATPSFGRATLLGRLLDYLGFYLLATWALWRRADRQTIVVAKTDPPLISIPAAFVCKLRGASLVNWLQDLFPEVAMVLGVPIARGPLGSILKRLRNWSLWRAKHNVVIGERMRDRLVQQGIPDSQIQVIHNWADGSAIRPIEPGENTLRGEWGLQGKFVVGYSGNLGRAHEFETILGAAKKLSEHNDIVFLFIGGGAQAEKIRSETEKHHLHNILFKPYQPRDRLEQSLGVADAHLVVLRPELEGLIVPSKFYGISAAGRSCLFIGDSDGEIAHLLSAADSGYTIQPGNTDALIEQIRLLHDNPGLREKLNNNARTQFETHFRLAMATSKWRQLLEH